MELDKLWRWQKKKLPCKIRLESGNPAGDSLRETFVELAGADLNELLNEMKATKKKKEAANKVLIDYESEKNFKELLFRSRVLGATKIALEDMAETDKLKSSSVTLKNKQKVFSMIPKSPPKRVMIEIQRERSKPLRLPDQEEHKSATEKLEKKLAKERKARMAKHEQLAREEEAIKKGNSKVEFAENSLMSDVFPQYRGDQFSTAGDYLNGMLYLSRMADSTIKTTRISKATSFANSEPDNDNDLAGNENNVIHEMEKGSGDKDIKYTGNEVDDQTNLREAANDLDANVKLNCAVSLCNWSRNPANSARLASEGAVRAIIQLAVEPINRMTIFCVAAFRYMSEFNELAVSMIEENALSTISDIINSNINTLDDFLATNLVIVLVNLTRVNGKEGQVVEGAIVLAIMNIITAKPELSAACSRGLYNLTCVDVSYPLIERVIRALVTLSMSGTSNIKHLCAAALCNLSDLKSVRPRMVEEGAIDVLSTLSRGAETRTRRVCAVILQNLSVANLSVRAAMASHNAVTAAFGLSSDQDPIILRCVGLTLSRLAMEKSNWQKIIAESGITALCNIAVKYPTIPGISQPVASAFQLMSSQPLARVEIVEEGSVTAIASLLRGSVDMFTLQHSLLALCNILCVPENHVQIVQQGLIQTLISMCSQENSFIKDFCSLAFLNLSVSEDSRKHIVNAGTIAAIIAIAKQSSEGTKRRCAATLCNITYFAGGMSRMVSDGIIPCIVNLAMSKDTLTIHYSCAAICRLCSIVENAKMILESSALPRLVEGAKQGDEATRQFCGAVLSSLSVHESCRTNLCEVGAITALKGLAYFKDGITRQRCLVAFANLSCEEVVQEKMIDDGVVTIISFLSNSYQEINYICCAKSICNLACCPNKKMKVATEGGVKSLLLISMVQSVDMLTKLLCVLGLNNLLDHTTVKFMLQEGIVFSVTNLSKMDDNHISNLCSKILNHLTKYPEARQNIAERQAALSALARLCESSNEETKHIAIRTCANLILCPQVRAAVIRADIFYCLEIGIKSVNSEQTTTETQSLLKFTSNGLNVRDTARQCLIALYSVCNDLSLMERMARDPAIALTLLQFAVASETTEEEYLYAIKTVSLLTWAEAPRTFLQNVEVAEALVNVIDRNPYLSGSVYLSAALRFLVLGFPGLEDYAELRMSIISALHKLVDLSIQNGIASQELHLYVIETMRTLSDMESCLDDLSSGTTIIALKNACQACMGDANAMYNIAVLLYRFASHSPQTRMNSSTSDAVSIMTAIYSMPKCPELVVITLGIFLTDTRTRLPFLNDQIALMIIKILDLRPSEGTLYNLTLCMYAMSKITSCRSLLLEPRISLDKVLLKLCSHESSRIKNQSSRALKNLNSDPNEAIEEGAVASLIAMSLEGKFNNKVNDDFIVPTITNQVEKKLPTPDWMKELETLNQFLQVLNETSSETKVANDHRWFDTVVVKKGGAAGKGPEPPAIKIDAVAGATEYPNMIEELESGEVEGKTKMAFAKMQVPQSFKESHLLDDADFKIYSEVDEMTEAETTSLIPGGAASESETAGQQSEELLKAGPNTKLPGLSRNNSKNSVSSREGRLSRQGTSSASAKQTLNDNSYGNELSSPDGSQIIDHESSPKLNGTSALSSQKKKPSTKNVKLSKLNQKEIVGSNNMSEQAARLGLYS